MKNIKDTFCKTKTAAVKKVDNVTKFHHAVLLQGTYSKVVEKRCEQGSVSMNLTIIYLSISAL